ncbi:MAG: hypothetical protein ACUVUE_00735 [Candidatus Bathycorpusculaceae bacterium]
MVGSSRKMLAAREDLVDKISEIANNRGFTLFGTLNSLLELAVKVENMGVSLEEVVNEYEVIRAAKEASFILAPENLLYETANLAYERARDKALKVWFEAGVWIAKQYITSGVEDPLTAAGRDLKAFAWDVPEFTIEKSAEEVSVRVLSPKFSHSYTLLFCRFLEGILETFGYKVTFKEVGRGNIRLEAVEREADAEG